MKFSVELEKMSEQVEGKLFRVPIIKIWSSKSLRSFHPPNGLAKFDTLQCAKCPFVDYNYPRYSRI